MVTLATALVTTPMGAWFLVHIVAVKQALLPEEAKE
jgi:hypothetical protein